MPKPKQTAHQRPNSGYLGLAEAAAYLDVSHNTIRRLIAANRLPGYRLGSRVIKVKIADLDAVLTPVTGGAA